MSTHRDGASRWYTYENLGGRMKLIRLKAALVAAALAVSSVVASTPAEAGSTSMTDGVGSDFDAACVFSTPASKASPPSSNWNKGNGCSSAGSVTTADGSHCSVDLTGFSLSSNASGQIAATFTIPERCTIPAAGGTSGGAMDLPASNFVGGNFYALFQNKTIQTNVPYVGCAPVPPRPTPIVGRFDSWKDGYHFFVGFAVNWNGTRWVHSARIGQYFPGPDGGFNFYELGVNDGSGWTSSNVRHTYGSDWSVGVTGNTITVTAPGVYEDPDPANCASGHFDYRYATSGDVIANAKALSTANAVVTLPVTVPTSTTCSLPLRVVCLSDITSVGGFVLFADTTAGNSVAGLLNTNIQGIAYSGGAAGVSDTLAEGPTCPTPTVGGALPSNPLFTPDTACHIDDDWLARGSVLSEWWDTTAGFTF